MLKRFLDLFRKKHKEEYVFDGENNKLLIWSNDINDYIETKEKIKGLNLDIKGHDNIVKIDDVSIIGRLNITFCSKNSVCHIGKSLHTNYACKILDLSIFIGSKNVDLDIGDNVMVSWNVGIFCGEPNCKCKIGNNVRLAEGVRIFATDGHPIIDLEQNKIINYGNGKRCLTIGNNCWIGLDSFVGKNGCLCDYTIVAAHSVITKPFNENNIIIAGNPAKIVKRNVRRIDTWEEAFDKYSY